MTDEIINVGQPTIIGNSWDKHLNLQQLQKMMDWVTARKAEGQQIRPDEGNILKAFKLTPFDEVKVVILGQDPYPGTDRAGKQHAMGMAFSSHSKIEVPASLKNIFKELALELGIDNQTADLTQWARQGVLLLNTVLTVEAGKSNSHKNMGWEAVTVEAIKALGQSDQPIVFMLWGKPAQKNEKYIKQDSSKLVLRAAHPSPLSARSGFFGCNHFVLANVFLADKGIGAMDWKL